MILFCKAVCGTLSWQLQFNIEVWGCGGKPTRAGMGISFYTYGTKSFALVEPLIQNKPGMGARGNGAQCKLTGIDFVLLVELSLKSDVTNSLVVV